MVKKKKEMSAEDRLRDSNPGIVKTVHLWVIVCIYMITWNASNGWLIIFDQTHQTIQLKSYEKNVQIVAFPNFIIW